MDFKFNFLGPENTPVAFTPYPQEDALIKTYTQDPKMHNGRLEIVRTGKGETGNTWVTLREMVNADGERMPVPKIS